MARAGLDSNSHADKKVSLAPPDILAPTRLSDQPGPVADLGYVVAVRPDVRVVLVPSARLGLLRR